MTLELKVTGIAPIAPTEWIRLGTNESGKNNLIDYHKFVSDCLEELRKAEFDGKFELTYLSKVVGPTNGNRVPFALTKGSDMFVMKPYSHEPEVERNVLRKLDGFIAPKPIYLGEKFIIEEFIEFEYSLNKIFKTDEEKAIKIGAETRAELFAKGITFKIDNNWMRDFVTRTNGNWRCFDFGHARHLFERDQSAEFDHAHSVITEFGAESYLNNFGGASFLKLYPQARDYDLHKSALDALVSIKGDSLTKANAYFSIRNALHGIIRDKLINECEDASEIITNMDRMETIAPIFMNNFARRYNELVN